MKYLFISIAGIVGILALYIGYTFSWSVKYKVGDCIKWGDKTYLFDSDGPLLKGSYGLTQVVPKIEEIDLAMPREMVESSEWTKVDCP